LHYIIMKERKKMTIGWHMWPASVEETGSSRNH